jgi:ketosteroid isomerase-like protein
MPRRLLIPLLALALVLPACGGDDADDRSQVEETVRNFVKATNDRDEDAFCDELVTQEFLEQATGAEGDQARDACKKQLGSVVGVRFALVDIKKTSIDGDSATVTAVLRLQGKQQPPRVLRLKKEDGDWKLAGGTGQ